MNSPELNQNQISAGLGEFFLDILHDDPDGLLPQSLDLGQSSGVFAFQSRLGVPGGEEDQVQDRGQAGQELGGTVVSHLGPVVGPALTQQVAGGQEDSGGQETGGHCAVPDLTTQYSVKSTQERTYLFQTEIQYSAGQSEDDLPTPPDNLAVIVEEGHGGGLPQLPLECDRHLLLHPGQLGFGPDTSGQGQEEVWPWGEIFLHLGCQLETGKTQQLDLLQVEVNFVEDEVKVDHCQVECLVVEGQILLNLKSG